MAILCAAYLMWRSGPFSMPLNVIGGVIGGDQLAFSPLLETVFNILYIFPLLFWIWMLWAGVVCWRRTPRS